jgi:thioesterase domain-containing protein
MAESYLRAVRQAQPRGPYYLGGYCFGGVVAFEMARQLQAVGETVGLVAIFEGYAPVRSAAGESRLAPSRLHHYWRNLPGWVADHRALGRDYTWRRVRHVSTQWLKQLGIRLGLRGPLRSLDIVAGAENMPDHRQRVLQAHLTASRQYQPRPYPGVVTLLNIRRQSMLRDPDPRRGWQRLAQGGVEIKVVAGSHHNILEVPHVSSLAGALRASLEQAQAGKNETEGGREVDQETV